MRFRVDGSWQRFDKVVLAGSPLRLFRLTAGGVVVAGEIEAGREVSRSALTDRLTDAGAAHPMPPDGPPQRFSVDDVTVVTPQLGGIAHDDGRITVDDGSVPPIASASLRLEVNRGPAAARNAARPLVATRLVAFVDADVIAEDQELMSAVASSLGLLLGRPLPPDTRDRFGECPLCGVCYDTGSAPCARCWAG